LGEVTVPEAVQTRKKERALSNYIHLENLSGAGNDMIKIC
jgi:hypothetical protein